MKFNHSKLLGRIREHGLTQQSLAKALDVTPGTLSLKLKGKSAFTTEEIDNICECLNISSSEIGTYFFAK